MRKLPLLLLLILPFPFHAEEPASPRVNAVKTTFLSWITGSSKLAYERAWPRCHQSSEVAVVMIGLGGDKYHNRPLGYSLRYAHKFFLAGNNRQPLTGFYLRPELMYVGYDYDHSQTHQRTRSDMGTLMSTVGYQLDLHHFIIDAYIGSGYAWGTPSETGYQHGFHVWDYLDTYNPHISMSFGIRLGYSF